MALNNDDKPTERRLDDATDLRPEDLCDIERYFEENGASELVYDKTLDVFRFPEDGKFAFCEEFADWTLLRERGYLDF
jgi:hypothetical protein